MQAHGKSLVEMNKSEKLRGFVLCVTSILIASGTLLYNTGSSVQGSVMTQRGGMEGGTGRLKREGDICAHIYLYIYQLCI